MKLIVSALLLFFISCSHSSKVSPSINESEILSQIKFHDEEISNFEEIEDKIKKFQLALKAKKFTEQDWKLHDELLNFYIKLKQDLSEEILVKAHSSKTIQAEGFCLDADKAIPVRDEKFVWTKDEPNIEYYEKILNYFKSHPSTPREDIQELIWNLQNETYFENYPEALKKILLDIDPSAPIKLPSKTKSDLTDAIVDNIPVLSDLKNGIELVKGEYYSYRDIRENIQKLKSNYTLPPGELQEIEDSELYAKTNSNGYSTQNITLYNPTDQDQKIRISDYVLEPYRKDVQRVGLARLGNFQKKKELEQRLERVLYGDMLRLGIGFTPGLNDVADVYELLTGREFITGNELNWQDRILSGVGIIAGSGAGYRYAKRAVYSPEKYLPEFEKGFERASGKNIRVQAEAKDSFQALEDFAKSSKGKRIVQRKKNGFDQIDNLAFKHFDKNLRLRNPLPEDGWYAHATTKSRAEEIRNGVGRLARGEEGWITAKKDLENYKASDLAKRLSLYADQQGKILKNTDDYVVVEFKLRDVNSSGIRSPIEIKGGRQFGWVPGGKTKGGTREWLIDSDAPQKGIIDLSSIRIREPQP